MSNDFPLSNIKMTSEEKELVGKHTAREELEAMLQWYRSKWKIPELTKEQSLQLICDEIANRTK